MEEPIRIVIVVSGGMVTDVGVSSSVAGDAEVDIIDLDCTDPVTQEENDRALEELSGDIASGEIESVF